MILIAVVLALLAALGNAAASVLQRRAAAAPQPPAAGRLSWLMRLVRQPVWLCGTGAMVFSGVCQAAALAAGPLSVVQPVTTTELLFTLALGSVVFRRNPGTHAWLAFCAIAAGLAAFLALASPAHGRTTVPPDLWLITALPGVAAVLILIAVSLRLHGAPRAAVLGAATAIGFAFTAALLKDATGLLSAGVTAFLTGWQLYTAAAVGLLSFLLLQATLRAGTLVASQPAMTLGDALLGVLLGAVLFDERIVLGHRVLPEIAALGLLVLGSVQLARTPLVSGRDGEQTW